MWVHQENPDPKFLQNFPRISQITENCSDFFNFVKSSIYITPPSVFAKFHKIFINLQKGLHYSPVNLTNFASSFRLFAYEYRENIKFKVLFMVLDNIQ